jgi:hypothetical protein
MRRAGAAVLLLLALVLVGGAASAQTAVLFSDPDQSPMTIQTSELAAINGVAAGGTYATALIGAATRGVHVHWFTLKRTFSRDPCGPKLADYLASSPTSFVRTCQNSCYNGWRATAQGAASSMHSKTMQVTYANGMRKTFVGSNDWTDRVNTREWNAAVVTYSPAIGNAVHRWFNGMRLHTGIASYPKQVTGAGLTLFQYPYLHQSGSDNVYTDTLDRVSCKGTTHVWVKASQWQPVMLPVVAQLGRMQRAGCVVRIISGRRTDAAVVAAFHRNHLAARQSGALSLDTPNGHHSHVKEVLADQVYRGRHHRVELLGSANMGCYWTSENNMVRFVPTAATLGRSVTQFGRIWATAHTTFATEAS